MDPLSLIANIIAVTTAASAVCERLYKISRLRNAPEELLQFHNEISDLQVVLVLVRETSVAGLGNENPDAMQILDTSIDRAAGVLHEFDSIMQKKIGIRTGDAIVSVTSFSWRSWLRNASRLRKLSTDLRTIRRDMNSTLTLLTACDIPRTRVRLAEIAIQNCNTENKLERFAASTTKQIEAITASVHTLQSIVATTDEVPGAHTAHQDPGSSIRIQTSLFSKGVCSQTCLCRCHKFTTFAFPDWLERVVGRVLVGYSGIPYLYRSPCNERRCQPDTSCLLTVSYYFPKWFLGRHMLYYRHRWTPIQGHAIVIRTPRVLPSSTEAVFMVVQAGNVPALSILFTKGLASPYDVEPVTFNSLLLIAVKMYHANTCAFLLNEHADPNMEDNEGMSVIDLVCSMIWTQSYDPKVRAIKDVFGKHLDLDEKIGDRGFTILHRIILNLSPISLRSQLETSTIELDLPCSMGRTPLHWAALQPDINAMETLIEFGASIHLQDKSGCNPLHHVAGRGYTSAAEVLIAAMNRRSQIWNLQDPKTNSNGTILAPNFPENLSKACLEQVTVHGHTVLGWCAFDENRTEVIKTLLAAGADVDASCTASCYPVGCAIQGNVHASIILLLEGGARLDWFDPDMLGTLHYIAQFGDIETMRIIERADGVRGLDTERKDISGHTPLEIFDIMRPQCTHEDKPKFLESRQEFLALLSRARGGTAKDPRTQGFIEEDEEDLDEFYDVDEGPEDKDDER